MNKKFKMANGTFQVGCGIIAYDENFDFYHFLVVTDRETQKPCVIFKDKVYFEADFEK